MARSASGLVEGVREIGNRFESSVLSVPTPKSKRERSAEKSAAERRKWAKTEDDAMVWKANEIFRQAAEKPAERKKAKGKLPGAAGGLKTAAKKKASARKRLAAKR